MGVAPMIFPVNPLPRIHASMVRAASAGFCPYRHVDELTNRAPVSVAMRLSRSTAGRSSRSSAVAWRPRHSSSLSPGSCGRSITRATTPS